MIVFLAIAMGAACIISSRFGASSKPSITASGAQVGTVGDLMAQAQACVGSDPHESQALRSAAFDFLRVANQR